MLKELLTGSRMLYQKVKRIIVSFLQENFVAIFLFIFTLEIYIHNLSSSIYGGDSGDIATAVITNGVAHPSGYPLQTMLGILFLKIPIEATPAWKIGLVSSLFSSLTLLLIYKTTVELTKSKLFGILTALSVAFTYSFWLYAEVIEVFALNSFFISALIYLTIKYLQNKKTKFLIILALTIGLSLTNNQSIIILFPFIALSIVISNWKILLDIKTIFKCILFLVAGLTPYLYVLLSAQNDPEMNWGFAKNWENFWFLVTRQYYGWGGGVNTIKMHYTIENIILRMGVYFDYWKSYINPLAPVLIILGIVQLIINKKILIVFFLLSSFLFVGPLFMIFAGSDFQSYLGLATIERFIISNILISFLFLPFGVISIENIIRSIRMVRKPIKHILPKIVPVVFSLIPIVSFIINFKRTDLSKVYVGDSLAVDVLSNLPENSVLMLRNDTLAFNTIYYQQAYNYRKDVMIPGMHNGFLINLQSIGKTNTEINNHIMRHKGGIDKDIFDRSIKAMLDENTNVFIDGIYSIYNNDPENRIVTIPLGLLYKFEYFKNLPHPEKTYLNTVSSIVGSYSIDDFSAHDDILSYSLVFSDIQKIYSADFYRISEYLVNQYNNKDEGSYYFIRSVQLDPYIQYNIPKSEY
ncbi:MAG: hypothetical protein US95_C0022G0004 [Candidatus Woesebacteria bacterium GW2011_GWB1_38_5]|uniref:Glycosyltransferase RgtA/B/C/D-like domain-containing protein n=4 Tax=Candidatus Woeseibacteriota TaxID=1752722 RepID=A0A0G0NBN4_9BACT|nr:MAG: hypothetical protein US75_C0001G0052 [Candidatus Woesebacteria bacterium GW2011_GWC1_38_13]KKQ74516.1 MAG: hypothetical protein US95_C0022G0004 [Candidatus Woesebacteria bacterium GW2011_GWB1_38_5]KKQ83548.1 MAG: hypothetical protein UT06_C0020G0011 [Candidatus Woesebacteria bacterium GW2011_GWA1_38_8]